jgi:pimeloyl-ACP methyl ester carboxylesterase
MRSVSLVRTVSSVIAVAIVLAAVTDPSHADVVILKDGFTLIGKVKREGQTIFEGGQKVTIGNGFYIVDDDVRRIAFSFRQVQDVDEKVLNKGPELVVLDQKLTPLSTATWIEPFGPILEITPFDNNWERKIKYQPLKGPVMDSKQRMTRLTPYMAVVEASRARWQMMYLTRELGPEVVRQLLYSHPDLRERAGEVDPLKRTKIVRFLIQAGFYDAAEAELDQWLKDSTKDQEKIEALKQHLQKQRGQELLDDIERCHKAGQHLMAQKLLAKFPQQGPEEKQLNKVQGFKTNYEADEQGLALARRFLKELPPRVSPEAHRIIFSEAAAAILSELNLDNYKRLERFVILAKQAEADRQKNTPTTETPGDLMAAAASGWVLGSGSAEAKTETGLRLWRTRKFVQEYQKTDSAAARAQLLANYQKERTEAVAFDEMAQVISLLPPIAPEEKLSTDLIPLETNLPQGGRKGVEYIVQLPREYHHGRPFPVLMVLHQGVEKPADALTRWLDMAHQHGYILVAPKWAGNAIRPSYNYSTEEHAVVLDSLRDLQRRFNVDCDRIFLAGVGQGGDMAFDVGLSHPDLFAGVVPLGAQPRYFAKSYATNGRVLPFYVVSGDLASDAPKMIRDQFKTFVAQGAPSLYVEYKGRGQEWFAGELPNIFDWMGRKKRAMSTPDLTECISHRATDTRFYWLAGEGINDRCIIHDTAKWKYLHPQATLQGKIAENNEISLHARNYQKVSVWFTRDMIAFDKAGKPLPMTIRMNTIIRMNNRVVTPSLATLLEDFYARGDRQRLFVAKVDIPLTDK